MIGLKKKIVFVFLLGVGIVFVIIFVVLRRPGEQMPIIKVSAPTPNITNYFEEGLSVKSTITEKEFNFPKELPTLQAVLGNPLTEDYINTTAGNLDISTSPIKAKDFAKGDVYIYNNEKHSLVIIPKTRTINYSLPISTQEAIDKTINKQVSEESQRSLAESFLKNILNIPSESIEFSDITFLEYKREFESPISTTKENADIYQLNYYPAVSDIPVITSNPQHSFYFVQLLKDGSVFKFEGVVFESITKSEAQYQIKNFEQFNKTLNDAVLVSLNNGSINLPDISRDYIRDISVNEVKLAYLLDEKNSLTLSPVFLLSGVATISKTSDKMNVSLYLPAFSQEDEYFSNFGSLQALPDEDN